MRPGPWRILLVRRLEERGGRGQREGWTRRWRLFGQCRLVHEQGSAFCCDLHERLPSEATGPNVTVFPAAHGGERHPECVREVFLREPGTLTPCTNHAGGIGRRHDLLGRGGRVLLPAHETAGLSRHTSFSRTLLGMVGARPNVAAHALSSRPHLLRSIA